MDENCFYCNDELEEMHSHGLFVYQNEHIDKALCRDCYKDWLEGIKG